MNMIPSYAYNKQLKHEKYQKENKKEISKTKAYPCGSLQVFFLYFQAGTKKYKFAFAVKTKKGTSTLSC